MDLVQLSRQTRTLVNSTRDLLEEGVTVDSSALSDRSGLDRLLCADFLLEEFRRGNLSVEPGLTTFRGWAFNR
jgi:hypothetical protein